MNSTQKAIFLWLFLILASLVIMGLSFRCDSVVRENIVSSQGKGWKKAPLAKAMNAASKYGDWPELMCLGAIGLVIAWRLRSREWIKIIIAAMIASTLAGALANTSRLTTGRPRPREAVELGARWYGPYHEGKILIGNPRYNSFPSGHTATAMAFVAVFLFTRPRLGILLLIPASLIAAARMYLGAHHFSDVITSTILSFFVAWFVWEFIRKKGDSLLERFCPLTRFKENT
ncbi:MAG: phosphatase PAP2 family protein [Chthoniobacterales bacterium]